MSDKNIVNLPKKSATSPVEKLYSSNPEQGMRV